MNEETPNSPPPTVAKRSDKELVTEIRTRARAAILTWLREQADFVFWHPFEQIASSEYQWLRFLGYSYRDHLDAASVVKVLTRESPFPFHSFEASWVADGRYQPHLLVNLMPEAEWTDAVAEAWDGMERPPHALSDPAHRLLSWAMEPAHQNQWIEKGALGRQACLRGTSWTIEFLVTHLKEARTKAVPNLRFETKETLVCVSFGPLQAPAPAAAEFGPLNPVCPVDLRRVVYAELDRFREALYNWILAADLPTDQRCLVVWRFQDRTTFRRCFPQWEPEDWKVSDLTTFLSETGIEHGLVWGYSFQDPDPWEYICAPKEGWTWERVKKSIQVARSGPSLASRYGISKDAAALLRWFTSLHPEKWFGAMTPLVEKHWETGIGIATDWNRENLGAFLTMLAEELTEKTEWRVRVQPWNVGWQQNGHRLVVRKKPTDIEAATREVQLVALSQGKLLPRDRVEAVLRHLLE